MLKSTYKQAALNSGAEQPLPDGWTEHTAPTGHKYFHHASTQQSTYTRPTVEPEEEELQIDFNATQPDHVIRASLLAQDEFQRNQAIGPQGQTQQQQHQRRRGHGGDRPKTKKSIPGAEPWLLLHTKFGRRFVHNTETKQSLWKFPQEVMMAVIEMDRVEWEKKKALEEGKVVQEGDEQRGVKSSEKSRPGEKIIEGIRQTHQENDYDSDDYEEVEVTDDEGADEQDQGQDSSSKRRRMSPSEPQRDPDQPPGPVTFDEDDIAYQLAALGEDDRYDYDDLPPEDDEEEGLPITEEDNIALFRSLLDDFQISPYSTFERLIEENPIVLDNRWTVLENTRSRKEAFTNWSKDRVAEEKAMKEMEPVQKQDPRIAYLEFLAGNANTKLFWPEFKRKFRKNAFMTAYEMNDKEREKIYREFVGKLKMSAEARRKDLAGLLKSTEKSQLSTTGSQVLPESALKDVRYWVVEEKTRKEVVDGWLSTL